APDPVELSRLAAHALGDRGIAGEFGAQHFRRPPPPDVLILGDPHLAHAADGDELHEPVPVAEHEVHFGFHSITASMTAFAIGAATFAPVASLPSEPPFSTTTATATWGSSAGAKAVNHACWAFSLPVSAVPVLPATFVPEICAGEPVP